MTLSFNLRSDVALGDAIARIHTAVDHLRVPAAITGSFQGCMLRFRLIMTTTMAALMGTLPIALGLGAGADARQPLGLPVVGGLAVSQFLTLYITPVIHIYLDTFQKKARKVFSKPQPAPAAAPSEESKPLPDRWN